MSENTRKYYITKGEEFEKAFKYVDALNSYLEAFDIKECSNEDEPDYFAPSFIEDKIAFLAYRLGDYRKALTFGGMAYRLNPSDTRLKNNLPFYTDGILYTNPKQNLDNYVSDYIIKMFDSDKTVLDVGPYDGRWSDKLRGHFKHLDAVEAFEPYIEQYGLKSKYDNIYISDVLNFDFDYYNLIIIGDVLEHLTIEDAQKLIDKIYNKCDNFIIIVPYEYPQDEYDANEYQIHKQEDLTHEIMKQRYPKLMRIAYDEVRGVYIKNESKYACEDLNLTPERKLPKTLEVALIYYSNRSYGIATGVIEDSLEEMTDEEKALSRYYLGLCYKNMNNDFEALKGFLEAVDCIPSYKTAYYEAFKILEKSGLWTDFEYYLRKAIKHKNEKCPLDTEEILYWENLLFIQMTFVLSNLGKKFEAYGYAALALETDMSEERKKIADYNYDEMKKELMGTLQI